MKTIIAVFTLMCFTLTITAQVDETPIDTTSYAPLYTYVETPEYHPKNFLKTNLSSFVLRNFSITYERIFTKRFSLNLGVRWMPNGNLPLKNTIIKIVGDDSDNSTEDEDLEDFIRETEVGGIAITLEPRFYIGEGYGKGFYFAPYYRYSNFKFGKISVDYQNEFNVEKTILIGGSIHAHSAGLMIGAQYFLGKGFVLDWWIIGAHYGFSNGDLTGSTAIPLNEYEQQEIKDVINGIEFSDNIKEINVDSNGVEVIMEGPWAGIRAFGISVGYRF